MASQDGPRRQSGLLSNLAGLLIASLACISILTVAVTGGAGNGFSQISARELVIMSVLAGAFCFVAAAVAILFYAVRDARRIEQQVAAEVTELRRRLSASDAALSVQPTTVVVWDAVGTPRLVAATQPQVPHTLSAVLMFRDWLSETSAVKLTRALDQLFQNNVPFNFIVDLSGGGQTEVDGRSRPGRVVLSVREIGDDRAKLSHAVEKFRTVSADLNGHRDLLDGLAMLVWFTDASGKITWTNKAYTAAVECESREQVVSEQKRLLESRQQSEIAKRLAGEGVFKSRIHLINAGERRAYEVIAVSQHRRIAYFASDVTELETAELALQQQTEAHGRTLDGVTTAVAIFAADQRLVFSNAAYAELWQLDPDWLATGPRDGEILDRLRERAMLPVEVDYRGWKSRVMDATRDAQEAEDWWHLPDGRTIHVIIEQRPDGGVTYLYDDATERLALESRYNELIGVQRETLDHLQEGVAVFATDGRLRLFNPAFARIWRLERGSLERAPHVDELVESLGDKIPDAAPWDEIKRSVTDFSDTRHTLDGQMTGLDGAVLAYAGLPLPDGATLVTFHDITDRRRVELALIERNEALEAADRLKSSFISHVSYELRTPLTNIIGFSELLSSPRIGPLNEKQREYLADVHASSNALQTIINDILDLATIDAGTFELKTGPGGTGRGDRICDRRTGRPRGPGPHEDRRRDGT